MGLGPWRRGRGVVVAAREGALVQEGAGAGSLGDGGVAIGPAGAEVGVGAGADGPPSEASIEGIVQRPLREMLLIAAPTVVTMASYTLMQFADGLMVSRIGPEPVYVAAQGNGGIVAWLLMSAILGVTGVVNTFVSQNLGAGRAERGAVYAWNALWLSVAGWAVLMLPAAWMVESIFAGMSFVEEAAGGVPEGVDGALVARRNEMQAGYARVMLIGGLGTLCGRAIGHYFYGLHRPLVVMGAALAGNVVNLLANAVLIYGEGGVEAGGGGPIDGFISGLAGLVGPVARGLGVPAMGVRGAALGTVLGAAVEFAIPMAIFLSPGYARRLGTLAGWRPSAGAIGELWRVGWAAGLMWVNELVCWSYLMTVLVPAGGRAAGEDPVVHNEAGWIALRYMHLSFMPAVGLQIAATAIVGRCMGMKRADLAESRAWLALRLGLGYMGLCALVFLIFREGLIGAFAPEETQGPAREALLAVGGRVMIAAAVFQLFDAMAIVMVGALRGAGDTVWPGVLTVMLSWGCIVGGGHAMIALAPGLGSLGPWIGGAAYIVLLGVGLIWRFRRGAWKRIELVKG